MEPQANPYATPASPVQDAVEAAPALWNPNSAALWSLLFSPVFGAWLQMRNWQALGQEDKARLSWNWCIGSVVVLIASIIAALLLPETHWFQKLGNRFGFILLITWYLANGKSQVAYVKERFGKEYPRKGWGLPLLVAFGTLIALFLVVVVLYVVLAATGLIQVPA